MEAAVSGERKGPDTVQIPFKHDPVNAGRNILPACQKELIHSREEKMADALNQDPAARPGQDGTSQWCLQRVCDEQRRREQMHELRTQQVSDAEGAAYSVDPE